MLSIQDGRQDNKSNVTEPPEIPFPLKIQPKSMKEALTRSLYGDEHPICKSIYENNYRWRDGAAVASIQLVS